MSVFRRGSEAWQRILEYAVFKEFPSETAPIVKQYADEAYRYCVHAFGPPEDAKKRYKVMQGKHSFFNRYLGDPTLIISQEMTSREELCETIAHEMYHRVTEGRKGLADEMWIKEMMAILTSQWFLRNQGFKDYADATRNNLLASAWKADVGIMRESSNGYRQYLRAGTPFYSDTFTQSVWRISYALQAAVKDIDLFSIIKASTLKNWIDSLPQDDQYAACRVLELPTEDKTVPHQEREIGRLFYALQAKGDKEALVEEFERLVHLQPTNSTAFFYLGYALQVAKRFEDAISAYTEAQKLGYTDKWLMNNIGSVHWHAGNYTFATEWFQKAVEQTPDWAQAYYFLGRSLNNLGNSGEARQNWEKVLTLSDEYYAKLSQKALLENPLQDAVTEL
jgi:tetratricopeptide (TPR) repeat protein